MGARAVAEGVGSCVGQGVVRGVGVAEGGRVAVATGKDGVGSDGVAAG